MTDEELERRFVQLTAMERDNQQLIREAFGSMKKLGELVVGFAEQQNTRTRQLEDALIRMEQGLIRLTALVEIFIKGSHNGGKQK